MDREKVVNQLETDYRDAEHRGWILVPISRRTVKNALALLKEQEAVKPEREHRGSGVTWWNVCGNCKTAISPNDKFCHECGRPVLWEGR